MLQNLEDFSPITPTYAASTSTPIQVGAPPRQEWVQKMPRQGSTVAYIPLGDDIGFLSGNMSDREKASWINLDFGNVLRFGV